MCGICGYFAFEETKKEFNLQEMTDIISHRGPDDSGTFIDDFVGLGHRRLSIIDLSHSGHQPMITEDKTCVIVFNGEIYNHISIRNELVSKGFKFVGTSDTEVILHGYSYWGVEILKKLNGIFAIAIFDRNKKRLLIARDRFGVKPLYYVNTDSEFVFSSEIKSILKSKVYTPKLSHASLHEFLYYGYALENRTMYKDIFKLLPGHYAIIEDNKCSVYKFYKPEDLIEDKIIFTETEAIYKTRELLETAVKNQLMSDVPVGVFLSGGIDSSSITAFASKHYNGKLKTYSAGFDFNDGHNELPLAKKLAKLYNTEHSEVFIKGADLPDIVKKLIFQHDEPFSDAANIPLYLLSKQVNQDCKVILQGDGGDELFGGYSRYHILKKINIYRNILGIANFLKPLIPIHSIKTRVERFHNLLSYKDSSKLFAFLLTLETEKDSPLKVLEYSFRMKLSLSNPFEYYDKLAKRFSGLKDLSQQMLWIDTMIILPDQFLEKVDKSTMANGVEVRVPFLDNDLSSFAMSLPTSIKLKNGVQKYILKKSLEGIVPDEVLYGVKKGFGVPFQNWLKGPLYELLIDSIYNPKIKNMNFLNYQQIDFLIKEHKNGNKDNGFMLWKLMNLCIWIDLYKIDLE